ncbi:hypothetical protein Sjap_006380 [Stephania japonica]|uniref:Uncharacterized protein n=1 Tax=Stephania japonica TaxID=461633 RepID=A0AAP0K862_9MAGN
MAKLQCDNSSSSSSSPVPIIGLYIAGASLVCLLLMLWDVFFAVRRKACYIPCQVFSLNSVTLTLLSIVSKLPVDLTTDMPSARDQLSKLTGTAMTCICIGFMAPSLANNKESENIPNIAALSIFIVTLVVNICIQIGTGVIYSFIVEHIMVLCFMLMLLVVCWFSTFEFDNEKITLILSNVGHFHTIRHRGEASFIRRVKCWYISTCINNPQLVILSRNAIFSSAIGPICIMCALVLLQATYRSIVVQTLEFCEGVSDYGWSMRIIVIIQIASIIIGALIIAFRWLPMVQHLDIDSSDLKEFIAGDLLEWMIWFSLVKRRSMRSSIMELSKFTIKLVMVFVLFVFIFAPIYVISSIVSWILRVTDLDTLRCCDDRATELLSLPSFPWITNEFGLQMMYKSSKKEVMHCVDNMTKWMNVKRELPRRHHMVEMLSKVHRATTPAVPQHLYRFVEIGKRVTSSYKVTCLSMVVLAKVVAPFFLSSSVLAKSMTDALREAFEIVYYIDEHVNSQIIDVRKRILAKLLWEGGEVNMSKLVTLENGQDGDDHPVKRAISNVDHACQILPYKFTVADELKTFMNFVKEQEYATMTELVDCVEQLFSEMLHHFLAQLPICVYKDVHKGSNNDYEERARRITKLLCELDSSLEDKVQWKFHDGWHSSHSCIIFDPPS